MSIKVEGWSEARRTLRTFPGGYLYFDLIGPDGKHIDSAVPMDRESKAAFAERAAKDYEYRTGLQLPSGSKLVFNEIFG